MKEKMKSTTGITLVALIITIIILLILATVTIRIVLSEGIIKRTENGVNSYNDAQANELAQLYDLEGKMRDILGEPSEELKFLREKMVGKSVMEITENNNGTYKFKELDIEFTREDVSLIEEGNKLSVDFSYNGNSYTFIVSNDESSIIESVNSSKVKWGQMTKVRPIPTTDELEDIMKGSSADLWGNGYKEVYGTDYPVATYYSEEEQKVIYLVLGVNNEIPTTIFLWHLDSKNEKWALLIYYLDTLKNTMTEEDWQRFVVDNGWETNKWYNCKGGSDFVPGTSYTGSTPIQLSDFEGGTIYSQSYLEKVINSF